jgi:hypothetical protein
MSRQRVASFALLAVIALATGFVFAGQVKAQLLNPSTRWPAARRCCATCRVSKQRTPTRARTIADLQAHAGRTSMQGPASQFFSRTEFLVRKAVGKPGIS